MGLGACWVSDASQQAPDKLDAALIFAPAPKIPVRTSVTAFPLEQANAALERLRRGELQGAAVLAVG